MSGFTERTSKKIDMVFVLALLTLFAATSFALVLIGARQYRLVTDAMNTNCETRTTTSYLAEKIRQNDTTGAITVCELKGVPALSILSTEEGTTYTTYIYFFENALRELVVTESSMFTLSSGDAIITMQDCDFALINPSLLCAEITDSAGKKQTLFFSLHSSAGKEEA